MVEVEEGAGQAGIVSFPRVLRRVSAFPGKRKARFFSGDRSRLNERENCTSGARRV